MPRTTRYYDITFRNGSGDLKTERVAGNTRDFARRQAYARDSRSPGGGGPYTHVATAFIPIGDRAR